MTVRYRFVLATSLIVFTVFGSVWPAAAATLYWDGPSGSSWNTTAPWDIAADGTGGDPVDFPGAPDIATFNVSTLTTPAQTVLVPGVVLPVQGLDFSTSVAVTIQGNGGNNAGLTIGTGGITKSGDEVTTIGNGASGSRLNLTLDGNQTWQNNSAVDSAIVAIRAGQTAILPKTATPTTLTLAGTNTGANIVEYALTDNTASGKLSIVKDGLGTWVLRPVLGVAASNNTFTGNLTVNQGILGVGSNTALGTGNTVVLNGGMLTGNALTLSGIANAISLTADSTIRPSNTAGTAVNTMTFTGDLTSSGSPGTGPTLTAGTLGGIANSSLALRGSMSGFNGRILINQLASDATTNHGTALLFSGTTPASVDGSNAKFEINGPGSTDNPTLGINGGVRVRIGFNATATTTKMGELSGSGSIAGGAAAGGNHTLEIGNLNTNSTFSGDILHFTGAGLVLGVTKVGTGSLTLSGNSDYVGATTVSNGTLVVGADAGIAKFQPTDAVAGVSIAGNVVTAPSAHGLADGDRIMAYSGMAQADVPTTANKPLYVKVLTPTTYQLFTDPGLTTLQTFTDKTGVVITMPTSLGSNTGPVIVGDGATNATLLAGTPAKPSVTIARPISTGGSGISTFGSDQNGNSVFAGTVSLNNSNATNLTSASTGGNQVLVSGKVTGSGWLHKVGAGVANLSNAANDGAGLYFVDQGTLKLSGSHDLGTGALSAYVVGYDAGMNGAFEVSGNLSAASATANSYSMEIGTHGTGVVNQLAGSSVSFGGAAGLIAVADEADGVGTYNLKGGTLDVAAGAQGAIFAGPGNASFNFTGGTLKVKQFNPNVLSGSFAGGGLTQNNTDGASLLDVTTNDTTVTGVYNVLGGTANVGAGHTLNVSGNTTVGAGGTVIGAGTIISNSISVDGTIAPGASAGTLTITGNLGLSSLATLNYELDATDQAVGATVNDLINLNGPGNLTLDGTLNVSVLNGTELAGNTVYRLFNYTGALTNQILNIGSIPVQAGYIATIDTTTLGQVNLAILPPTTSVPGDFNSDGNVDGADFSAWQSHFPQGSGATLTQGDADGDGDIDGADFIVWQTHFPHSSGSASPVPEPSAWILAAIAVVGLSARGFGMRT